MANFELEETIPTLPFETDVRPDLPCYDKCNKITSMELITLENPEPNVALSFCWKGINNSNDEESMSIIMLDHHNVDNYKKKIVTKRINTFLEHNQITQKEPIDFVWFKNMTVKYTGKIIGNKLIF